MKRLLKGAAIVFSLLLLSSASLADGYDVKITFKVKGLKDTVVTLGYHYGEQKLILDSLQIDSKGVGVYQNDSLPGGIYLFITPDKNYFEFIVSGTESNFTIETELENLSDKLKVTGSAENKLFYDNNRFIAERSREIMDARKWLDSHKEEKDSTGTVIKELTKAEKDSAKIMKDKIQKLNNEIMDSRMKLIKENPDSFWAKVLTTMRDPEVPESPKNEAGEEIDKRFSYNYFVEHFWDNIDFSDERLVRTPLLNSKLKQYFENMVLQHPDTIICHADRVIEKASANDMVFQFVYVYIHNKYANSKLMGMDKVFVHLADKYYCQGRAFWADEATVTRICDLADTWRPLLIGRVPPNLIYFDTLEKPVTVHGVDAKYTILYFWDPDCGHCKKATPKLRKSYDAIKAEGAEVMAICTEFERDKWIEFINKHDLGVWINVNSPKEKYNGFREYYDISSTPQVYIIDDKKEIIAKKLGVEQIEDFLKRYNEEQAKKEEKKEEAKPGTCGWK